jgi:hypothetical protein
MPDLVHAVGFITGLALAVYLRTIRGFSLLTAFAVGMGVFLLVIGFEQIVAIRIRH